MLLDNAITGRVTCVRSSRSRRKGADSDEFEARVAMKNFVSATKITLTRPGDERIVLLNADPHLTLEADGRTEGFVEGDDPDGRIERRLTAGRSLPDAYKMTVDTEGQNPDLFWSTHVLRAAKAAEDGRVRVEVSIDKYIEPLKRF
jgi:hypothetical protein